MENIKEFSGYWAIILGGSSGLGLATAKKLAAYGMNICIVHRDRKSNLEQLNYTFKQIEALGVEVRSFNKDALQTETMNEVLSVIPIQKTKLLLHSIAKGSLKPLLNPNGAILSKTDIDITLHAMGSSWYIWTQALITNKSFAVNGRNIAFTSEGNTKVWTGYAAVSAAKATLESFMRSMSVELAPLGIRTNCIQAGATITPSFSMIPGSEKLAQFAMKRNPFNQLTTPENVANAVYLLCKDEANWINGTVLKVDGGESNL